MHALEAGVAALGAFDENPNDYSKEPISGEPLN